MAELRGGFQEIVTGWMLVDDWHALTDRIERVAEWSKANGPLRPDESATVRMMIECQIATVPDDVVDDIERELSRVAP